MCTKKKNQLNRIADNVVHEYAKFLDKIRFLAEGSSAWLSSISLSVEVLGLEEIITAAKVITQLVIITSSR